MDGAILESLNTFIGQHQDIPNIFVEVQNIVLNLKKIYNDQSFGSHHGISHWCFLFFALSGRNSCECVEKFEGTYVNFKHWSMLFFTFTLPYLITMHQVYIFLLNTILIFFPLAGWLFLFLPQTVLNLRGGLGSEFDRSLQEKQWQNRPNQVDPWIVERDSFFPFNVDKMPAMNKLLFSKSLGLSWGKSPKIKSIHLSATFYCLESCALMWILSRLITEWQSIIQFPCRNCLTLVKWWGHLVVMVLKA